jgi:tetratricopeptide (TPR) repeat protein
MALLLAAIAAPAAAQTSQAYFEFLVARRLEAQGDTAGALAALKRAVAADPSSAELRAEIAALHLRHDEIEEAERTALDALEINDANLAAHRVLGLIYAGHVDAMDSTVPAAQVQAEAGKALKHLERAGDGLSNADIALQYSLGRLYLRTGEAAKAIAAFTRVVDQNPSSVQGSLSLAQAYAAADDLKRAVSTLEAIVADEPRVAGALAQYQEQAGLLKEAAESYTRALAVDPSNRGLKLRRVATLFNAGEFSKAAQFAADAQREHPEDLRFPRLRARALFAAGEVAGALTVLEPTAKAFPNDVATQITLANLYDDAGRDTDAERTLRQLLARDPANPEALNSLGYLLAQRGRLLDEAVTLVQRALEADPNNPSYLDSLGWAHFRRGDLEQAERYLVPAAEQLPRNSVIQDHLGDVLAGRGRLLEAIAAWTRALAGEGDDINRAAIEQKINDARSRLAR